MKKCNEWLGSLTSWEDEMKKFEDEHETLMEYNSRANRALLVAPNTHVDAPKV